MTKSDSSEKTAGTNLLQGIKGPADIKALKEKDLPQLAQEVRNELVSVLSQTGGHLGPNLGVVELTIAMHRVFETPKDKFVFDVSHQGYVHKMFTGRLARIGTMRQYEGLNGFLLRTESEHDCYGAGHAGTALSAALGEVSALTVEARLQLRYEKFRRMGEEGSAFIDTEKPMPGADGGAAKASSP